VGYKKIVAGLIVLGIVAAMLVPKIQSVILFRDKAGANRLTLWTYSVEFLTASPKKFYCRRRGTAVFSQDPKTTLRRQGHGTPDLSA
jgi:hypothetical protein